MRNDVGYSLLRFSLAVSLGVLPFVPSVLDPVAIFLVIALGGYSGLVLFKRGWVGINCYGVYIVFFIGYLVLVNSLVSFVHDNDLAVFFRGVVPFLFFLFFTVFWNDTRLTDKAAYDLAWLASVFWLVKIFLFHAFDIFRVLSGELARLSYVVSDVLIPFGLVGFVLTLYKGGVRGAVRLLLLAGFGGVIILSGYRSQFLMMVAVLLFYLRVWRNLLGMGLALVLFLIIGFLYFEGFLVVEVLVNRMSSSAGDSVRGAELDFAFSKFYESPIFGLGLTVPVPVELTRPDYVTGFFEKDTVPYIHNFFGYFLMNTGAIGTVGILVALCWPLFISGVRWLKGDRLHNEGIFIVLFLLIVFFSVSASFRQIQTVLVFMLLALFVFKRNRDRLV